MCRQTDTAMKRLGCRLQDELEAQQLEVAHLLDRNADLAAELQAARDECSSWDVKRQLQRLNSLQEMPPRHDGLLADAQGTELCFTAIRPEPERWFVRLLASFYA